MNNSYISTQELKDLRKQFKIDQDDMLEYKKRGKGVKYIPKERKKDYITLTYAIMLLDKLIAMMHRGNYLRGRIIDALKTQDWKYYSYSNKAYHGKMLYQVLMVEKKDTYDSLKELKQVIKLLDIQNYHQDLFFLFF